MYRACGNRSARSCTWVAKIPAAIAVMMLLGLLTSGTGVSLITVASASPSMPTVKAAQTALGDVLVDAKGMVLYRYTADKRRCERLLYGMPDALAGAGVPIRWPAHRWSRCESACPRRDHAERREEAGDVRRLATLHLFCRPGTRTSNGAGRQGHTRDLVRRLRQSGEEPNTEGLARSGPRRLPR